MKFISTSLVAFGRQQHSNRGKREPRSNLALLSRYRKDLSTGKRPGGCEAQLDGQLRMPIIERAVSRCSLPCPVIHNDIIQSLQRGMEAQSIQVAIIILYPHGATEEAELT